MTLSGLQGAGHLTLKAKAEFGINGTDYASNLAGQTTGV